MGHREDSIAQEGPPPKRSRQAAKFKKMLESVMFMPIACDNNLTALDGDLLAAAKQNADSHVQPLTSFHWARMIEKKGYTFSELVQK